MIDLKFLRGLIRAIDESGIDSIEITRGGTRIRLSKTPLPVLTTNAASAVGSVDERGNPNTALAVEAPGAERAESLAAGEGRAAEAAPGLLEVESPMVGTFYRAPAPDAPPYVEVGSRVSQRDTLCIIEAMKLMNELESEVDGVVAEICAENAEPVEYGQVLFRIKPL